jgi:enamine deaminase RidA (YjgF/YER057c/UK114 family)
VAERRQVSSGSPYEATVGFSRAVRVGDRIIVSGTAPIEADGSCAPGAERQAARCFEIILTALQELGAGPEHVVRTRMFIVHRYYAEDVGKAHRAVFGEVRPAATMIVVPSLLDVQWKVEIEAEAVAP